MFMSVRFCLSYDHLNLILLPLKFVYSNENFIAVIEVVMMLLVPAKSVI